MTVPLDAFVAALDSEVEPARVAALPTRARRLVDDLGEALEREAKKKKPVPPKGRSEPPKPARSTKRVRISDVTSVRHLHTEAEWDELRAKLDERVRTLLRDYDVELE
jgi:hypothetical protein